MLRTCGQITDITGADLWVMDPAVRYIDDVKPMLENNLNRVRGVEGVLWAVPLYKGTARAKINPDVARGNQPTVIEQVILLGLDDTSLVGAPHSSKILAGSLRDLRQPDAVIVDNVRLEKLYPEEKWNELPKLGKAFYQRFLAAPVRDERPSRDHRGRLRGDADLPVEPGRLHDLRACQDVRSPGTEDPLLRPGQDGARSTRPRRWPSRIKAETGLGAMSSDDFMWMTIDYYLRYTGIPFNFGITAFLGFLVGTAIAGQTFYNFTLENLKQFGALKAMGMTNGRIVRMILLQATVVGLLGYGIGVGLAALFGWRVAGDGAGLLHAVVAAADHGGRHRPDLHPVEPAQRAASDPARTGDRLPLRQTVRERSSCDHFHSRQGID